MKPIPKKKKKKSWEETLIFKKWGRRAESALRFEPAWQEC